MFQRVITEVLKTFDLQPLQYLASVRVAISICEAEDVQDILRTFRKAGVPQAGAFAFSYSQWKQLRRQERKKLVQIGVPRLIIDIILERLLNISFEIFKWITNHAEDTGIECSSTYCWTPRFTIDYVKTAEMLTENDALEVKKRFKLACFYCLESKVGSLWKMMSLSEKEPFYFRGNLKKFNQNPILLYWTYYIQGIPIDLLHCKELTHTEIYKYSVTSGYLSATKYFLNKLKRRNYMISNSFRNQLSCDFYKPISVVKDHLAIACFLISQLPSVSRENTFYHTFSLVFRYFLEWPWQRHFMTVVNQLRDYIWDTIFVQLLEAIFEKEMEGFRDYDYKEIFKEFWVQGSEECKSMVNMESRVGTKILLDFVNKHFGFLFKGKCFTLKRKFRNIVLHQSVSENAPYFEQENVEFLKFLVLEKVATKSSMKRYSRQRWRYRIVELQKYLDFPLGELMFLIRGLLKTV